MIRRLFAFAMTALMLTAVFSGAAGAEGLATPTDLDCAHEHTKTTIYFYDSPAYTPIDANSHRVYGPAAVETVCLDCGELLSAETADNAEEIRPHRMKKGACVLCGYREAARAEESPQGNRTGRTGEQTIAAREDGNVRGLLTATLSGAELAALERAGVTTVLIRGNKGSAAFSLNVKDALAQTEAAGADLYVELEEQEDGRLFAGLYLVFASGERVRAEGGGASLRFYRDRGAGNRVSVAPAGTDIPMETEGIWNEGGYWSVPYTTEGTYSLLQQ